MQENANTGTVTSAVTEGKIILITRSPEDFHALQNLDIPALLITQKDSWLQENAATLTGAFVAVITPASDDGIQFANDIMEQIRMFAHSTRIVSLYDSPDDTVVHFIRATSCDAEQLIEAVQSESEHLAPWYSYNDKGKLIFNADVLASCISKKVPFLISRRPGDQKEVVLLYKDGVYRFAAESEVITMIRKYFPVGFAKNSYLKETYRMLLTQKEHLCDPADLNADMTRINFMNGILNLQTRELEPHTPSFFSTIQISSDYNPAADSSSVFNGFMNDLCATPEGSLDEEKLAVLQEFCGLVLSNIPGFKLKKALVLYSPMGNTGKSQLLGLLNDLVGARNVATVALQNMHEGHKFALGSIAGRRLISNGDQSCSEIKDSAVFKSLTGGDPIKLEQKFKDPQTIKWGGCILLACNNLPRFLDDRGTHLFERLAVIPCLNVIEQERRDPDILEKMLLEKEAIVSWCIKGLFRLLENEYRLTRSSACEEILKQYREEVDSVYAFVEKHYTLTGRSQDRLRKNIFDARYMKWCESEGLEAVPQREIGKRLEAMGCHCKQARIGGVAGVIAVHGIKEKATPEINVA